MTRDLRIGLDGNNSNEGEEGKRHKTPGHYVLEAQVDDRGWHLLGDHLSLTNANRNTVVARWSKENVGILRTFRERQGGGLLRVRALPSRSYSEGRIVR